MKTSVRDFAGACCKCVFKVADNYYAVARSDDNAPTMEFDFTEWHIAR